MFAVPIYPSCIRDRKIKRTHLVFGTCLLFLLVIKGVYAMQPPPPPLTVVELKKLVSEADVIVVGEVGRIGETDSIDKGEKNKSTEVEVTLKLEKLLKGEVSSKTIRIKECLPAFDSVRVGAGSKKKIIGVRVGPSYYHGKYIQGARIIVLLSKIEGTDEYAPLGSGTYDKYLCEFLIKDIGIRAFYFRFADDVGKYVGSEEQFVGLIRKLIESDSEKENK